MVDYSKTGTSGRSRLYLDNAATSFPKPPQVLEEMTDYAMRLAASAGRGAYHEAIETGAIVTGCRHRLNQLFNGENTNHFIFTLNCSDAFNLAIKGLIDPLRHDAGRLTYRSNDNSTKNALQERQYTIKLSKELPSYMC